MESFKNSHPDYEAYQSDLYDVTEIPPEVVRGIKGLIPRYCAEDGPSLKDTTNAFLTRIPDAETTNWGWDWLIDDFNAAVDRLADRSMPKFLDAIGVFWNEVSDGEFGPELEELLEEQGFGYYIESGEDAWEPYWALRDERTESVATEIDDVIEELPDPFGQAMEHLAQAKTQLRREDDRSRKNAIRDGRVTRTGPLPALVWLGV